MLHLLWSHDLIMGVVLLQSLQPLNGLVSGQKAKQILIRSNLPIDKLGKVSCGNADKCHAVAVILPCARFIQQ